MDAVQRATEGHLVGTAWIKRRAEDPIVVAMCSTTPAQCDRVTLSERARHVEPISESGASRR